MLVYNTTRGPISVALGDGSSGTLPPKQWVELSNAAVGSASIAYYKSKNLIKVKASPEKKPVSEVSNG